MGKVPVDLRRNVATNIRNCRHRKYPQWGGSKQCAEDFGVSPQQWSQWERGAHMPDEFRMIEIASFFDVTIEFLRRDNSMMAPTLSDGAVRMSSREHLVADDEPLRVEVERIPHPSFLMGQTWRGVTITIERKY